MATAPPSLIVASPVTRDIGGGFEDITVDVFQRHKVGTAEQTEEKVLNHLLGVGRRGRTTHEKPHQGRAKTTGERSERSGIIRDGFTR